MSSCNRITPKDMQVCIVRFKDGHEEYAIWDTGYSMYGAGGHFVLGSGGQAGIPCDVMAWWGTHWIADEQPGIAISGQKAITGE